MGHTAYSQPPSPSDMVVGSILGVWNVAGWLGVVSPHYGPSALTPALAVKAGMVKLGILSGLLLGWGARLLTLAA